MRDSQKAEIARISESVARSMFTQAALYWGVDREVHARLPEMIRRHADGLLPQLAKAAVADATPDLGEAQVSVERALRETLRAEAAEAVTSSSARVLPELAERAVRAAAPDPEATRAELVAKAAPEVSGLVREQATKAVAELMDKAGDGVRSTVAEVLERESAKVLPGLARAAVAQATPDPAQLREHLLHEATAELSGTVHKAVTEVARQAQGDLVERVTAVALARVRKTAHVEVEKLLAKFSPTVVSVVLPEGKKVELAEDTHAVLPELLLALHARCHVLLVGPAGTGKSMLARHAASALGLEFQALSLGPTTPMSKVFGYYDANGQYHDTPFRRAFQHGGVMLLDELDNGHPGLLAELNQALALGVCAFADGMVTAHPDFRMVATGNTYGTGGDRQYVGRQTLDSATLDRFVVIDVPIDEGLEERIARRHAPSHPDAVDELIEEIRDLRETALEKKLPVIISPRASIDGAKLLEAGATVEQVMQWRVIRGLSEAHRAALGLD
ncbi:AAA family ATPase [Amycolatopsis sp. NPDC051903]|uniref:AAA family ATPase n=1 Tax=Amycolatopsis sp. NPDC051903 TaxID=3363936 RepID=UPI0037B57BBC